jgi:5-(carboxyamino)imidazole ribonucleotide mutase
MKNKIKVLVIIGSESDRERIVKLPKTLEWFGITYELVVSSAHRHPDKTVELAKSAKLKGIQVIIAAAGMAAHLPGVIAAYTSLPVIGVPLDASALKGIDALLSIAQMPPGVPVATVGIDGAVNAGVLAARIIALEDKAVAKKLEEFITGGSKT